MNNKGIKIIEYSQKLLTKRGKVVIDSKNFGTYEKNTAFCLASFGFDVEILKPSNIPKSKNPDLYMLGTFWEVKTLLTANQSTIKAHFSKATKQANGKAVFDLRYYKGDRAGMEQYLIRLFNTSRKMRRLMIINSRGDKVTTIDLIR